jgi:hypothetical protein
VWTANLDHHFRVGPLARYIQIQPCLGELGISAFAF